MMNTQTQTTNNEINVRSKFAELTRGFRSQIDLDGLISRTGGLNNLFRTEFPGADRGEFLYELESVRMSFRGRMTEEG